jgi:hypothetical protein
MKILIAIPTCHRNVAKTWACRTTWVKDVQGADVKFFLSHLDGYAQLADEILLPCPDDYYNGLRIKVAQVRLWALHHGYDYLWKVDDDCYLRPERLLPLSGPDYFGEWRRSAFGSYANGFCYGMSKQAMLLAKPEHAPFADWQEDRGLGESLMRVGVEMTDTKLIAELGYRTNEVIAPNNTLAASCEFEPVEMLKIHARFQPAIE